MKKVTRKLFMLIVMALVLTGVTPELPIQTAKQISTVEAAAKVKLNKASASIVKGKTLQLKLTGTKKKVTWKSSNKKVATVNSKGKVTAKGKGAATITAKVGGKTYACKVTVKAATTIKISKTKLSLNVGDTSTLKITGTTKKVSWTSNKKSVATVNSKGKVTAKKAGTATITAKVNGKKYTCKVTVSKKTNILKASTNAIKISQSGDIFITYDVEGTVSYRVGDNSIVSCAWGEWSGNTLPLNITGKKSGTTTITITNTYNSEKVVVNVTVDMSAQSVSLDKTSVEAQIGESFSLQATVLPAYAENKNVTWSSSDEKIATVTSRGIVTCKSAGQATITVSTDSGNHMAICTVNVISPVRIKLPDLPTSVSSYTYSGRLDSICKVTNISLEISKSGSRYYYKIYFDGEKAYSRSNSSSACKIGYKLYKDGAVVESGVVYSSAVGINEKFAGAYTNGFLDEGDYELVLLNVR